MFIYRFILKLSYGDVNAALLALKLGEAKPLLAFGVHDLGKNVFQIFVRDFVGGVDAVELGPTDVESGAVAVAGVGGGVAVVSLKLRDGLLGAHDACDLDAIGHFATARAECVGKIVGNGRKKLRGFWHQIGHGVGERLNEKPIGGGDLDHRRREVVG